ncbi:MAG TPA: hypothetical protein PLV59_03755 [Candidatus Dojkabacteria bacterium]|nr:hypothetical protein [Candidatus Dojkabacteria bacterium]
MPTPDSIPTLEFVTKELMELGLYPENTQEILDRLEWFDIRQESDQHESIHTYFYILLAGVNLPGEGPESNIKTTEIPLHAINVGNMEIVKKLPDPSIALRKVQDTRLAGTSGTHLLFAIKTDELEQLNIGLKNDLDTKMYLFNIKKAIDQRKFEIKTSREKKAKNKK